ncbi:hypothetical protein KAI04_01215 [Candidatus Pacearchaeota archaeon]|nr:hypothetical protein [Candidatus Pacearchaeota archaeon]
MIKLLKKDKIKAKQFSKEEIPKLKYGMIHSLFGDTEGVSIVMNQIEEVLNKKLKVPIRNINYLIGNSKIKSKRITESELLSTKNETTLLMRKNYQVGYGGGSSEKIEETITKAKETIKRFIKRNKIDVLISHNSSHPVNFISSVALSRYYRDEILKGNKIPKYILWWHDSHLERKEFLSPARDVENYLLQGVPGPFVEYILFINSLQFKEARKYLKKLDQRDPGFYKRIETNNDIIYNTTDTFIEKFGDLQTDKFNETVDTFMRDFKVENLLGEKELKLSEVLFCLQHTRVVGRKRIDFALEFCYELLEKLRKRGRYKSIYFFISGQDPDKKRKELIQLNKKLQEKYNHENIFLVFAEDYSNKTKLTFEEYPKVFAKLKAITTYFSEIEGFGNNLLEVLASGLIPIVYAYPVFKKDISKCNFKLITFNKFQLNSKKIQETVNLIFDEDKRRKWVNHNLRVLKDNFNHDLIAVKLVQAITSERGNV